MLFSLKNLARTRHRGARWARYADFTFVMGLTRSRVMHLTGAAAVIFASPERAGHELPLLRFVRGRGRVASGLDERDSGTNRVA